MRALWIVLYAVLSSGCLEAPPPAIDPDSDGCAALDFGSLDGFHVNEATGCRVWATGGRLHLAQEGVVAGADGCFVEPQTSFAVGSIQIAYGAESDLPVSVVVYRKSDLVALGLTRYGGLFELSVRTDEQVLLGSEDADFEPSWTLWRIEFGGEIVEAKAGPDPGALETRLVLPFVLDSEVGIVIGSWPGGGAAAMRGATFDDLAICPP